MTLKYKLVQKGNPAKPDVPKKFYAISIIENTIDVRTLAEEIARISTVSTADTAAVLECLLSIIPDHVINGELVRLGEIGSFSVNIKSEGAESEEKFTPSMLHGVKLIFRPGKVMKSRLTNVKYQKQS